MRKSFPLEFDNLVEMASCDPYRFVSKPSFNRNRDHGAKVGGDDPDFPPA
jgi:hypothetical protein